MKTKQNKTGLSIKQLEKSILNPNKTKTSVLRLRTPYNLIEYRNKNLKELFNDLRERILLINSGLVEATEMDRFVLIVLKAMAGD